MLLQHKLKKLLSCKKVRVCVSVCVCVCVCVCVWGGGGGVCRCHTLLMSEGRGAKDYKTKPSSRTMYHTEVCKLFIF